MAHAALTDHDIATILRDVQTIALVGASPKPERPSHGVMAFLLSRGKRVIPVNPGQAGKEILGQTVVARLADIAEPIDMVDVFRAASELDGVVAEAAALSPRPKVIWGQLGVADAAAAARAEAAGMTMVMDRCPKIEFARLGL